MAEFEDPIQALNRLIQRTDLPSQVQQNIDIIIDRQRDLSELYSQGPDQRAAIVTLEHLDKFLKAGAVLPIGTDYHTTSKEPGHGKGEDPEKDHITLHVIFSSDQNHPGLDRLHSIRTAQLSAINRAKQDCIVSALGLPHESYAVGIAVSEIIWRLEEATDPGKEQLNKLLSVLHGQIDVMAAIRGLKDEQEETLNEHVWAEEAPVGYLMNKWEISEDVLKKAISSAENRGGILMVFTPETIDRYNRPEGSEIPIIDTRIFPQGIPLSEVEMVIPLGDIEKEFLKKLAAP